MIIRTTLLNLYTKLFCRKIFFKIHFFLFKISLRGIGILNFEKSINGETFLIKHFLKNKKNPVIFDVGANIGEYSEMAKKINPTSEIYAFEPHPVAFKKLQISANQYRYNNFQIALGDKNDSVILYDHHENVGSGHASLYKEVIEDLHKDIPSQFLVSMQTLDSFCTDRRISKIDFLKIDVEGNELRVLQGAQSLISQHRIDMIVFEFNEMNLVSRVFLYDFFKILPNYNFFRLLSDGIVEIQYSSLHEISNYQNIFALHKKYNR